MLAAGQQVDGIQLLLPKRLFSIPRQVKLPNAERAFVDIAKLRDYSLSPLHKEGRHKARVFASALGLGVSDAEWLSERLQEAVRAQECQLGKQTPYGQRYLLDFGLRRGQ